jgi:hypothetical protein
MTKMMMILGALVGFGVGVARADGFVFDVGNPVGVNDDPWAWGTVCDGRSCRCDTRFGAEESCADFAGRCEESDFDRTECLPSSIGFWDRGRPHVVCTCWASRGRADQRRGEVDAREGVELR